MLLPILDYEDHDAIILTHSYSGVPGSAAVAGLSKAARAEQGKKTGVLGQIMLAAILTKGGDGASIKDAFGGQFPPHMRVDVCPRFLSHVHRLPSVPPTQSLEKKGLTTSTGNQRPRPLRRPHPPTLQRRRARPRRRGRHLGHGTRSDLLHLAVSPRDLGL